MSETRATSSEISLRQAGKFRGYVGRYPSNTHRATALLWDTRRNQRLRAEPATAVRIGVSSVSSISSNVRPLGSYPNAQKPINPSTYHDAKYKKAGPSMTRFGAAGLMRSPAPMMSANPSGPTNLPRLPTP